MTIFGNEEWPVVGATGHRRLRTRPDEEDWAIQTAGELLRRCRDHHGTTTVASGMALGWDMIIAQAAIGLGMDLLAIIPFAQQPERWLPSQERRWRLLLDRAKEVRTCGDVPLDLPDGERGLRATRLMHRRNDRLISTSHAILALWNPRSTTGGTYSVVKKVIARSRPLIHVDPAAHVVEGPGRCTHLSALRSTPSSTSASPSS